MDTKKGKNKGLNAFLDKQVKKGKKKATTEEQKTETVQTDTQEQNIVQESEATQKPTKTQKAELSDEEVEENDLELANQIQFAKVKEQKDVIQKKEDETQKTNYGYDNTAVTGQVQNEPKKNSFAKKSDGPSEITFGGRPKFGRVKKNTFADFKEGIDDIDLDGNVVKSKKTFTSSGESNTVSRADGGRGDNFINMSSGGLGARAPRTEEESKGAFGGLGSKSTGVRPTFKGRAKLNTNQDPVEDSNQAGMKSYDFKVSFADKHENPAEGGVPGDRKVKGFTGNKYVPFGQTETKKEDDEFTFVSSQKRIRNTKPKNANDSESEGEEKNRDDREGAFTITRGPQRGNRGGMGGGEF